VAAVTVVATADRARVAAAIVAGTVADAPAAIAAETVVVIAETAAAMTDRLKSTSTSL
jgi:hypothetical protein